jgi:hypothetical protein
VKGGLDSVRVASGGFMTMRDTPDAPAGNIPQLYVELRGVDPPRMVAALTGQSLASFDDKTLRRLLGLLLADTRRVALPPIKNVGGLRAYLALANPVERQIVAGSGVFDRNCRSAAYVNLSGNSPRVFAAGTEWAERRLLTVIDRWRAIGSPALELLRIRVMYGADRPRAWRTSRRGRSWIAFDWARKTPSA